MELWEIKNKHVRLKSNIEITFDLSSIFTKDYKFWDLIKDLKKHKWFTEEVERSFVHIGHRYFKEQKSN